MCPLMSAGDPVAPVLSASDAPVLFGCSAFMAFSWCRTFSAKWGGHPDMTQRRCPAEAVMDLDLDRQNGTPSASLSTGISSQTVCSPFSNLRASSRSAKAWSRFSCALVLSQSLARDFLGIGLLVASGLRDGSEPALASAT